MDLFRSYSDEDVPVALKKKDLGFDVKEKIKELMKKSSPVSNRSVFKSHQQPSRKRQRDDINRGVGHGVKKPKFSKAKEKQGNKARKIIRRMKDIKLPPRMPADRSPVKPGGKPKWHKLSSPGTSLLDSPDSSQEESSSHGQKFFTSRSRAAAIVNINETIKLSSRNGEITMNQKRSYFEKKNIGRVIELELEKKIAAASLQSPNNIKRLENVSLLSSVTNRSTPPKPTRYPSSPSPRKQTSASRNNNIPIRTSPRKQTASSSIGTPTRRASPRKQTEDSLTNTPTRRTSPRKQILKTIDTATPPKSPRNSPYRRSARNSPYRRSVKKDQANGAVDRTPNSSSKRSKDPSQIISLSKKKSLLKSLECTEEEMQQNGELEDLEDGVLQDMESAFEQMESNTEEDKILSSILRENQSPNKEGSSLRSSPRKKSSPCKENLLPQCSSSEKLQSSPRKPNEKVRYFPVFEPKKSVTTSFPVIKKPSSHNLNFPKKKFVMKKTDKDQMIIDAGQKEFGPTFCKECGTLYEVGNPEDEENHLMAHAFVSSGLRFNGWKSERQVTHMDRMGGRVIKVIHTDNPQWWRKVKEVLKIVDDDLGFCESSIRCMTNTTAFLYILEKQIAGLLITESIEKAYRVIQEGNPSTDKEEMNKLICCSETPVKVAFGISRIWVLATQRKNGVATKLVDAMRANLLSYHFLSVDDFAFSDPTQSGMAFAEKYTKKTDFLVYRRE